MIFSTKRLAVRQLVPDDFEPFHAMQSDPDVMRYTTGRINSWEENKAELAELIQRYQRPEEGFWVWAVCLEPEGSFVGTAAIVYNEFQQYEIGYRFLQKYWGRGYGKEICEGLTDHWASTGQGPLYAYVDVLNTASVAILDQSKFDFVKSWENEKYDCTERIYKFESNK